MCIILYQTKNHSRMRTSSNALYHMFCGSAIRLPIIGTKY